MKSLRILIILVLLLALIVGMTACGNSDAQQEAFSETAEQDLPSADPTASVDLLIGSWTDINSPDRFANISAEGTGYQFEDNDGKYAAVFKDGVLQVKVSDTDTADVFVDEFNAEHMYLVYEGNLSEFRKK